MKKTLAYLFVAYLLVAGVSAFAANFTIGLPPDSNTGNCFPFGCAYSGEYQQVYNSGQFPGLISITGLSFFNTAFNSGATAMNSGNWAISLSTTAADWNTISGVYAANLGLNNTLVFNGDLSQPWAFGNTLNITFSTPFLYDPSKGNLLMDVVVTGASAPGGNLFFDTNGAFVANTYLGRVYCNGCFPLGFVNNGYGLVTGFTTGPVTVTPEPASLALFGSGVLGLAGLIRRKLSR